MGLVSTTRYAQITGDDFSDAAASARIPTALADAQALLVDDLRRPLEVAERTERCELLTDARGTFVLPKALPLVSSADGLTISGPALVGPSPDGSPVTHGWGGGQAPLYSTVTYTGGYQASDASPDLGAETVPAWIERDLAWAAWLLARPGLVAVLAGKAAASSVTLGDAAIVYTISGPTGGVPSPSQAGITWSRRTWSHRRNRL